MDDCGGRRWGGRQLELEEVRGAGSRHRTCTHMHDFPLLFREVSVWGGIVWGVAFGEVAYAFRIISFSIFHRALTR